MWCAEKPSSKSRCSTPSLRARWRSVSAAGTRPRMRWASPMGTSSRGSWACRPAARSRASTTSQLSRARCSSGPSSASGRSAQMKVQSHLAVFSATRPASAAAKGASLLLQCRTCSAAWGSSARASCSRRRMWGQKSSPTLRAVLPPASVAASVAVSAPRQMERASSSESAPAGRRRYSPRRACGVAVALTAPPSLTTTTASAAQATARAMFRAGPRTRAAASGGRNWAVTRRTRPCSPLTSTPSGRHQSSKSAGPGSSSATVARRSFQRRCTSGSPSSSSMTWPSSEDAVRTTRSRVWAGGHSAASATHCATTAASHRGGSSSAPRSSPTALHTRRSAAGSQALRARVADHSEAASGQAPCAGAASAKAPGGRCRRKRATESTQSCMALALPRSSSSCRSISSSMASGTTVLERASSISARISPEDEGSSTSHARCRSWAVASTTPGSTSVRPWCRQTRFRASLSSRRSRRSSGSGTRRRARRHCSSPRKWPRSVRSQVSTRPLRTFRKASAPGGSRGSAGTRCACRQPARTLGPSQGFVSGTSQHAGPWPGAASGSPEASTSAPSSQSAWPLATAPATSAATSMRPAPRRALARSLSTTRSSEPWRIVAPTSSSFPTCRAQRSRNSLRSRIGETFTRRSACWCQET
mmetsp:Transcript_94557/g.294361  ORF Transcript_94557/g.294361 Transcript_94557/m.294361 type:complete len:648 (+) Transcript_94557:807-2750(+)